MADILEGLNSAQLEAVTSTEGRVRVVAGAGSGKTKALTYRYAYIVNELGVEPANILCLTFTNKAAQEMRSRITQLVPPGYTNDFVCTIHGFCVRFLREEIHRLGYPKNFQILDEEDMKSLARQVLTENNTERSVKTVRQLLEALAGTKAAEPRRSPEGLTFRSVSSFCSSKRTRWRSTTMTSSSSPDIFFRHIQR